MKGLMFLAVVGTLIVCATLARADGSGVCLPEQFIEVKESAIDELHDKLRVEPDLALFFSLCSFRGKTCYSYVIAHERQKNVILPLADQMAEICECSPRVFIIYPSGDQEEIPR